MVRLFTVMTFFVFGTDTALADLSLIWRSHSEPGLAFTEDSIQASLDVNDKVVYLNYSSTLEDFKQKLRATLYEARESKSKVVVYLISHGDNVYATPGSYNGFAYGKYSEDQWSEGHITYEQFIGGVKESIDQTGAYDITIDFRIHPCANGEIITHLKTHFDSTYKNIKFYILDGIRGLGRTNGHGNMQESLNFSTVLGTDSDTDKEIKGTFPDFYRRQLNPDYGYLNFGADDNVIWNPGYVSRHDQKIDVKILEVLSRHSNPAMREMVLSNIRKTKNNSAVGVINSLREDPDSSVKFWAIYSYGILRTDDIKIIQWLKSIYLSDPKNFSIITVLGMIAKPNAVSVLAELYSDLGGLDVKSDYFVEAILDHVPSIERVVPQMAPYKTQTDLYFKLLERAKIKCLEPGLANSIAKDFCGSLRTAMK